MDKCHIRKYADFTFWINSELQLHFNMHVGYSMVYSGMLLTHRQKILPNDHVIMNTSAYGNAKLFHHVRSTIQKSLNVSTIYCYVMCNILESTNNLYCYFFLRISNRST